MRPRDWTAWRGHVRTSHCWKRRESPQPGYRARKATQSLGLLPGPPVTTAVNPSRPDTQPRPRPSSSTGYQAPGHGHSKERGRRLGGGWGGSCSKVQAPVWEHLHWDRGMERQSEGGDHRGWRQASGEKRKRLPTSGGGDGVPRRRPPTAWKRRPCLRLVTSGAYMPTAALCPPGAQSIPAGGR